MNPAPAPERLNRLCLFVGAPGSGKTLAMQKCERVARTSPPRPGYKRPTFVIHDMMGHWEPKPGRTVIVSDNVEDACVAAIDLAPTNLIVDELGLCLSPDMGPPKPKSALREILLVGRQARHVGQWKRRGGVGFLGAAQSPNSVHPILKRILNRLYVGRFPPTATRDLEWIEDATNSREIALRATKLQELEFICLELNP